MYGLVKHASEIYTQTLFRDFEAEYKYAIASLIKNYDQVGSAYMYEVWIENDESSKQQVSFNSTTNMVECVCKNFEEVGWLCFHCLRVLLQHSVTRIPEAYICKRWTKSAKSEIWKKKEEQQSQDQRVRDKFVPWRNEMARKTYNLILKSQEYKETRERYEEKHKDTSNEIDELIEQKQMEKEQQEKQAGDDGKESNEEPILVPLVEDPKKAKTKGRGKRIKGHFEKNKQPNMKKTKAMIARGDKRDFDTKTPTQKETLF